MTVNAPTTTVRSDFDRIARLSDHRWETNAAYHRFLLRRLAATMQDALEIGCAAGAG